MQDEHMKRALDLAAHGLGHVSPNPMVGAVVVADGQVVGQGWHRRLGGPHAEVEALRDAGARARGATMYVTLEPCNHHGRTPPCAPALVDAGLRRVVIATADPNPRVAGGGAGMLRAHGVEVEMGMCEREARDLNRAFFTWARHGRPFVTLKTALSLDGRIACRTGQSRWITGPESRRRVHEERGLHDAILVGVGTVLADDPRLDVRLDGEHRSPQVVVVDTSLRTPPQARALPGAWIYCVVDEGRAAIEAAGARVIKVEPDDGGRPCLAEVLLDLGRRGVTSLLVEGGGTVQRAFLAASLADRLLAFVAPVVVGGVEAPTPLGRRGAAPEQRLRALAQASANRIGDDVMIEGLLQEVWV